MWPVRLRFGAIPPAIRLGLLREAGADPVEGHHAIGLEFQQVLRGEVLRLLERAAEHAHLGQRDGPRAHQPFLERANAGILSGVLSAQRRRFGGGVARERAECDRGGGRC